ncbi:MAG: transcriptional repressor [Anaerolineae bacterium]|nr:transcriptional repressor [Anaerolineae bacterium]
MQVANKDYSLDTSKAIRQQLNEHGLRATPQRLLVLQILEEAEEHLDAESISQLAHARDPKISLATVYRTLNKLKDVNLVAQRYFARDHKREYYEKVAKKEHYHFTCMSCGEIIELHTPRIRQAKQELSQELGIMFSHACMCFEGYCAQCAQNRGGDDAAVSQSSLAMETEK